MKNGVLYSLVALMVIALGGIIVLQSLWVSKAISDQEKEFENHVNLALNDVNSALDEEEALFYLEDGLGALEDSLEAYAHDWETSESEIIANENRIEIAIKNNTTDVHFRQIEEEDELPIDEIKEALRTLEVRVDTDLDIGDSAIFITESKRNKLDNISTVVRRYVMESSFSGELSDRISKSTLDSVLRRQLNKQGITLEPEFAVYRKENSTILPEFTSKGYDQSKKESNFRKALFPNDRIINNGFELFVQLEGTDGFVWSGIQSIVIMCVLFTLLILTCFAYSLHFIFKQKRMSQVKNDFINNMTHELKTPLASISLAASSIQHPNVIGNPDEIQRFISIIRSEEKRMNEHVERVLDMAALDYQELKMNYEANDLIELVRASIEHIQLAVDSSNGKVKLTTELKEAPMRMDQFHLLSALINILDNSVKYRNEDLEINVGLTEVSEGYQLRFSDNGIGMKKSSVKHAFDKFYREETGNIHTRKGFGLGLSYVKSIIELHKGTIELTSEVNNGTEVLINLPKS